MKNVNKHPRYHGYRDMIRRCEDPSHKDYPNYGAKGIKVCAEWKDFRFFLKDMGERPTGMTLDRIDNSKGYFKENCRWATRKQQTDNRRISYECQKGHLWTKESTIHTHNGVRPTRRCRICYESRIAKLKALRVVK